MKRNPTYRVHARRTKKTRRRLLFTSLFIVLLLFCGFVVTHFGKTPEPWAKTDSSQMVQTEEMQLAWPAVGQAAIASVEDKLLASSSKNEKPRPTASMAKVITALAIMEKQPFELGQAGQTYTLTSQDVTNYHAHVTKGGSAVQVYEGMVLTQYQAMQLMLIASSNNMADTLVERVFGGSEAYTSYAQNMVQRMGLRQTVIADASGFSPATVSMPSELVAIGIKALENPVIAEIVAQPQAWIPEVGTIKNTNELLGADGVIGMKTGTTHEAGSCLLFAARYEAGDGKRVTLVGVIMGDTNATRLFGDTRQLLASAKQGFGVGEAGSESNDATPPSNHSVRMSR